MSKVARFAAVLLVGQLLAAPAHAVLIDRGGGLIYDTDLNVTWLQDASYAITSGAAGAGMNWANGVAWASNLRYYDPVRGVWWDDWRLPTTINSPTSSGWDTSGLSSELAYMYYINLGYAAQAVDRSLPSPTSGNYNPFVNLSYLGYWSGTDAMIPDRQRSWAFHFHFGWQTANSQADSLRLWAVRDGDVAAASVPEPGTFELELLGLSLVALGFGRRKVLA